MKKLGFRAVKDAHITKMKIQVSKASLLGSITDDINYVLHSWYIENWLLVAKMALSSTEGGGKDMCTKVTKHLLVICTSS